MKNPFVKISNCIKYSSADVCSECDDKFYLNANKTQCVSHTAQQVLNCASYSRTVNGQCEICDPNYYKNGNTCVARTLTSIVNCSSLS